MGRWRKEDLAANAELCRIVVAAVRAGERIEYLSRIFGYSTTTIYNVCKGAGLSGKLTPRIHTLITKEKLPSLVIVTTKNCWVWPGCRNKSGYAQIGSFLGHRLAFELFNGAIPDGMQVCHHCDNPPCMNPDHLFLGTMADNMRDCTQKGRRAKGERSGAAKLNNEAITGIRKMRFKGGFTLQEIATRYGTTRENIRLIVSGRTWKHIPNEAEEAAA